MQMSQYEKKFIKKSKNNCSNLPWTILVEADFRHMPAKFQTILIGGSGEEDFWIFIWKKMTKSIIKSTKMYAAPPSVHSWYKPIQGTRFLSIKAIWIRVLRIKLKMLSFICGWPWFDLSRSLKVKSDTFTWKPIHDFLFAYNSNHMPMMHH